MTATRVKLYSLQPRACRTSNNTERGTIPQNKSSVRALVPAGDKVITAACARDDTSTGLLEPLMQFKALCSPACSPRRACMAYCVTWTSTTDVDHGDGVSRGLEIHELSCEGRTVQRPGGATSRVLTAGEQAAFDSLVVAVLSLPAGRGANNHEFRLSEYVNDEGSHDEELRIFSLAGSPAAPPVELKHIQLSQGSSYTPPPDSLKKLYRLVVSRELDSC